MSITDTKRRFEIPNVTAQASEAFQHSFTSTRARRCIRTYSIFGREINAPKDTHSHTHLHACVEIRSRDIFIVWVGASINHYDLFFFLSRIPTTTVRQIISTYPLTGNRSLVFSTSSRGEICLPKYSFFQRIIVSIRLMPFPYYRTHSSCCRSTCDSLKSNVISGI